MFTGLQARNGELYISSFELARVTGKTHGRILLDIKEERAKLQALVPSLKAVDKTFLEAVLEGFSEESYIDSTGRVRPMFHLSELVVKIMLARYSLKVVLHFMELFEQYRPILLAPPMYVCLIKDLDTENFKVGTTTDVEKALAYLQENWDGELSIYYASLVCSKDIEEKVHNHFRAYKLRGEWFSSKLDKLEVIDYIEAQEEEYE